MSYSVNFALSSCLGLLLMSGCAAQPNDDDDGPECNLLSDSAPEVFIDEPNNAEMHSIDDAINWLVRVEDEDSMSTEIDLHALDLTDGTPQDINFDVPGPGEEGRSLFTLSGDTLGDGVIVVRITATDELGCQGEDQVVLCIDVPMSECDFDAR